MIWFRLTTAITIFLTSCVALGYFAERWLRRHDWPGWVSGLMTFGIAVLWPVIVVAYVIYDANRYLVQHPHDDAPGMVVVSVIYVGAPFLFLCSILPAVVGALIARRRNSSRQSSSA
jgi:hypothetical protein